MDKLNIDFSKFSLRTLRKIKNNIFKNYMYDENQVLKTCKTLTKDYVEKGLEIKCANGLFAIVTYVITKDIIAHNVNVSLDDLARAKNITLCLCSNYISPYADVYFPLYIYGNYNYIGGGYKLGNNISIDNYVELCDNNIVDNVKKTIIGNNVVFDNNVKVYASVGDNCHIMEGCRVREEIPANFVVSCRNSIQYKTFSDRSNLPSQTLSCYGCVPKYKDTLMIYGEGFYNPKVKIVVPYGKADFGVCYWDKNKIILKFSAFQSVGEVGKCTMVLFSNGQRIGLVNDLGLLKLLKTLKK